MSLFATYIHRILCELKQMDIQLVFLQKSICIYVDVKVDYEQWNRMLLPTNTALFI